MTTERHKRRRHTRKAKVMARCDLSSKVRYPSQRAAQDALIVMKHAADGRRGAHVPVRSYQCGSCDGWHLTSMEDDA